MKKFLISNFKFLINKGVTGQFWRMIYVADKDMSKLSKQKGFTLLEAVIVIVVIGFVLLLIANIPFSFSLNNKSRHKDIAREIASKRMEELRKTSYANIALGQTQVADSRINNLPQGSATLNVEQCPTSDCLDPKVREKTKKVTVTITWRELEIDEKIEVFTLMSESGLNSENL